MEELSSAEAASPRNFSSTGVKQLSSLLMRVVVPPMWPPVEGPSPLEALVERLGDSPWRSSFMPILEALGVGEVQRVLAPSEGVGREGFGLWIWLEGTCCAWVKQVEGSCFSGSLLLQGFCWWNMHWAPGEQEEAEDASLLGTKLWGRGLGLLSGPGKEVEGEGRLGAWLEEEEFRNWLRGQLRARTGSFGCPAWAPLHAEAAISGCQVLVEMAANLSVISSGLAPTLPKQPLTPFPLAS